MSRFNVGANQPEVPLRQLVTAGFAVLVTQLALALGLAVSLYILLPIVFGQEFTDATPMALALLPGLAVDGVATVAEGYLRGRGRPLSTLRPRCVGAVTLGTLALLLYPTWHALSIPIAASAGHAVSGVAILWVAVRDQRANGKQAMESK